MEQATTDKRVPIEYAFPWRQLRDVSRRQGTRRPVIYSIHRWWARRPPALFRSILSHLVDGKVTSGTQPLAGKTVLDPFMGGGTSLVEAQSLGAEVVGFDVEQLACRITALELADRPPDAVWKEIEASLAPLEKQMRPYYPSWGSWEVLHYFWVDAVICRSCRRRFHAHPKALLARDKEAGWQVLFCRYCSRLHHVSIDRSLVFCPCGRKTRIADCNAAGGKYACPWCKSEERITDYVKKVGKTSRQLVAKEEVNRETGHRRFRGITWRDHDAFGTAVQHLRRVEGGLPIPRARVTTIPGDARPRSYGFQQYRDMFNERQLLHHGKVLKALQQLPEPARSIGLIVFSESLTTNCMFCPYAADWRRLAALFSIHGYMYVTRPVELNPWLTGFGRGTLRNCLLKAKRALDSKVRVVGQPSPKVHLWLGSLDRSSGGIPRVDFVVTDPPYFDNLNYGYLARFYDAWLGTQRRPRSVLQKVGGKPLVATANADTWKAFQTRLSRILTRCRARLKPQGVLVLTFAQRRKEAWAALEESLKGARFRVTAIYAVETEGRNGFHNLKGNLRWNALFVCRPRGHAENTRLKAEARKALNLRGISKADRASIRMALKVAGCCR